VCLKNLNTLVLLEEVRSADWAVGGKQLTTSDVHALAAGHK
jgi:phenylpyruvate tautomerase PptA (4-oxalocrotonate tautomerase family)